LFPLAAHQYAGQWCTSAYVDSNFASAILSKHDKANLTDINRNYHQHCYLNNDSPAESGA
jgi:hypothetical protein